MPTALLLRLWPAVPILMMVVFFFMWQGQVKANGKLSEQLKTQAAYSKGLTNQLEEANSKIKEVAKKGAIAYGQCQDIVTNDATKNFDLGVTFGRSTCPIINSQPSSPAQSSLH